MFVCAMSFDWSANPVLDDEQTPLTYCQTFQCSPRLTQTIVLCFCFGKLLKVVTPRVFQDATLVRATQKDRCCRL